MMFKCFDTFFLMVGEVCVNLVKISKSEPIHLTFMFIIVLKGSLLMKKRFAKSTNTVDNLPNQKK